MKNKKVYKYLSIFNKLLCGVIVLVGVYFVFGVNDLSIKGFVLQEVKIEVVELAEENKKKELLVMQLESYESLTEKAKEMQLVKVDKIDYIFVDKDFVAMK